MRSFTVEDGTFASVSLPFARDEGASASAGVPFREIYAHMRFKRLHAINFDPHY